MNHHIIVYVYNALHLLLLFLLLPQYTRNYTQAHTSIKQPLSMGSEL